jgi:hypothetical protein
MDKETLRITAPTKKNGFSKVEIRGVTTIVTDHIRLPH